MAKFTRADIRRIIGENCTDEIENAIIALHIGVVDPLKDDLQKAKEDADKLPTVQKELNDLKTAQKNGEDYKLKYDALVQENAEKAAKTAKTDALRKLLKDIGISDKRLDSVLKISDIGAIKLTDKGEIENAEKLKESLKTEWADFIVTREEHGANPATPPQNNGGKKYTSKDEILAIKDTAERQKAIVDNRNLFGY